MNRNTAFLDQLPRPFVIYGMGISGLSILQLLTFLKIEQKDIFCLDDKKDYGYSKEQILNSVKIGTLIVSPGISLQEKWIQDYLGKGGLLSSELEIAFSFLTTEKIISVTGSLGKSTTCALIHQALLTDDKNSFLGGNFGVPLANYVVNCLHESHKRAKYIVLELSSYQLENFKNLKSEISVITYLTKNHMDRYDSISDYYNTKLTLIYKTNGITICNKNGGDLFQYLSNRPFPSIKWVDRQNILIQKYNLNQAALLGEHNQDNLSLVAEVCSQLNLADEAYIALKKYPGLPHRLENLGVRKGITFINDSKATTIDSTIEAITTVLHKYTNQNIYVLLGGKDKGLPWEKLSEFKQNKNLIFIFFGECRLLAQEKSGLNGDIFTSLKDALTALSGRTVENDIVLLSPGGTSLDEFNNFEERGLFFKNEILKYWSN